MMPIVRGVWHRGVRVGSDPGLPCSPGAVYEEFARAPRRSSAGDPAIIVCEASHPFQQLTCGRRQRHRPAFHIVVADHDGLTHSDRLVISDTPDAVAQRETGLTDISDVQSDL